MQFIKKRFVMRNKKLIESYGWKHVLVNSAVVFLLVFAYAVIRYNVIKGVGVESIPLYISNKAIAVASVILIGISYLIGPFARFWPKKFAPSLYLRKYFGLVGFGFAALHSIISLILFSPAYYAKFFSADGKLNFTGELSMLFGVIALFIFSIVAITSIPSVESSVDKKKWLVVQRLGYAAFAFVMLHVLVMGLEGWLKPETWPGGLLPMSLIAFIVIALTLLIRILAALFARQR